MESESEPAERLLREVQCQLARWRVPDGVGADDLLAETWLRWRRAAAAGSDPVGGPVAGQLLGIARNVWREAWRKARRDRRCASVVEPDLLPCFGGASGGDEAARSMLQRWLEQFLPSVAVELLLAVRWDDCSWREGFAMVGVDGREALGLQRRILRFLSDPGVRKSFASWVAKSDFPSLPFPLVRTGSAIQSVAFTVAPARDLLQIPGVQTTYESRIHGGLVVRGSCAGCFSGARAVACRLSGAGGCRYIHRRRNRHRLFRCPM